MNDSQTDGEGDQGRSFSLFDPVAGMRAVADIQAEGLRAAGELLERVLGAEPDRSDTAQEPPSKEYSALVDAWIELVSRTVAGFVPPGGSGSVTVPVGSNGVGPLVRLKRDEDDDYSSEVWLHNGTFGPVGPMKLRCGRLRNSKGKKLKGADVRFKPRKVPRLAARSSRTVTVSLVADRPLRPGTYRGTIQAEGEPNLWVPLEVVID